METVIRLLPNPGKSFFLFGPRGTGKSTWVKTVYKDALSIDLLSPEPFRNYSANPERLIEAIEGDHARKTIVLDEIQRVPALLDVVHELIEKKRGYQFVMTGSSPRKLKRHGVNLLAGRAAVRTLHPFMAAELGGSFDFKRALRYGLLPLVWESSDSEDALKAYIALYLREEIQIEGLVRNVGNFSRFLEAISFSHASVFNLSNVARECQVERKTVEGYVKILEDLLLAFFLPVFSKRAKRQLSSHNKFYMFDAGVYRFLRPQGHLDHPQEIEGLALEGLVYQHLRAWNAYSGDKNALSFWRTRSGVEVDFIVYGPDEFRAIEVKNSSRVRDEYLRGLISFKQDYPECETMFLYRGRERLKKNGVLCLPCEEFLRQLKPGALWRN
jgi:predicted AAA+ superfamily ATPase